MTTRAASRVSRTSRTSSSAACRDLLVGRLAAELARQLLGDATDLALTLTDVHRDADRPRPVRDCALDRLADPEGRVRRELEALAVVELLGGADQPEDPLLDEIEQRHVVALVLARVGDDQPEVGVDESLLRREVAALDPLGRARSPRHG